MGVDERPVHGTNELTSLVDHTDCDGFSIVDHLERRRCAVDTSGPVDPEELPASEFDLPVDRTVSLTTGRLSIPHPIVGYVRDRDGEPMAEITKGDRRTFREERYRIELTTPIKLYAVVESAFEIEMTEERLTIDFGGQSDVVLGVRVHHDRPAATVTTTDDPVDLMRAVSSFGSALKTTSCERSYPTLRGHPPAIEYGDAFSLPDVLDPPETGIIIEVPPEYGAVYTVSPLAYYLGATVVPGGDPVITADTGFAHRLGDDSRDFEKSVERVLKQCLFLDCVTRTEGHYPVDLYERTRIEDAVSLDFSELYGRPLADQLEAYLDVPYSVVEPYVPAWKLTAHVESGPGPAEALPFVVRELAAIRTVDSTDRDATANGTSELLGIDEFVRAQGSTRPEGDSGTITGHEPAVRIDETDALEDMWIGDGVPVGASKGMIEAFRNHVTRSPSDGDIDITVVVNDHGMVEESREVNEVYGSREELPFDVTVAKQLTTAELGTVLRGETDFLHYIGHIDECGFECSDGRFNAADINETGVDAFFLNACESYKQGTHLVESGAIAGVTTLTPVSNDEAEAMGKNLARLLNLGFPLYAALDVASTGQDYNDYTVVGNSSFNIVQPDVGVASSIQIKKKSESYDAMYYTYPTNRVSIGSITKPLIDNVQKYFLTSGETGEFKLNKRELDEFISLGEFPVINKSNIYWVEDNSGEI
jgi:hypothetical protein